MVHLIPWNFHSFFEEAYYSTNPSTGRPCLKVGDIVVMDNCQFHHNKGGQRLRDFLDDLNIELVTCPVIIWILVLHNMF